MAGVEREQFENLPYREVFEISDLAAALVNRQIRVALIYVSGGNFNPAVQLRLVVPTELNIAREAIWNSHKANLPLGKDPTAFGKLTLGFYKGEKAFISNGDILSVVDIFTLEEPSVILSYQSNSQIKVESVPDEPKGERPFLVVWQEDSRKKETVVLASDKRWANRIVDKYINLKEGQLISIEAVGFSEAFAVLYRWYLSGRRIPQLLIDYFGLDTLSVPDRLVDLDGLMGKAERIRIKPA